MNAKDQFKVTNFGMTIVRADLQRLRIKYKNKIHPEWTYLDDKFKSRAALMREIKRILESPVCVED